MIDYFAIIGFDSKQLKLLVDEILNPEILSKNFDFKGSVLSDMSDVLGTNVNNSGINRSLRASILT